MSTQPPSKPTLRDDTGTALGGYDPVSYFAEGPLPGDPARTATHNGATYRFATDENKAAFAADPDRYVPQYGGYCATALSEGKLVPANPLRWKITGGRLFVFYKTDEDDTLPAWEADEAAMTKRADDIWASETYVET